ncbi:MAG: helix-turn-helix domain-containing protein [Clostridia bacterium]|nr:helix-turn-helix domain-containing protein [Clostridia bacterium]
MEQRAVPTVFWGGSKSKSGFLHPSLFQLSTELHFLHYHDVLELGVCLGGTGRYITDDGETPFRAGDVQVVFPFCPHYNVADEGGSLWAFIDVDVARIHSPHLSVDPAFFLELSRNASASGIYTGEAAPAVVSAVTEIHTLIRSERAGDSPVVDLITSKLVSLLLELSLPKNETGESVWSKPFNETILPAIRHAAYAVEKGESITIKDLADVCFLSESYFRKLFLETMGEAPKSYLDRLRLQKAAALLVTTRCSVAEIAHRCCFEDPSTFYRRFVSAYGRSPLAYRQRSKGEKESL